MGQGVQGLAPQGLVAVEAVVDIQQMVVRERLPTMALLLVVAVVLVGVAEAEAMVILEARPVAVAVPGCSGPAPTAVAVLAAHPEQEVAAGRAAQAVQLPLLVELMAVVAVVMIQEIQQATVALVL